MFVFLELAGGSGGEMRYQQVKEVILFAPGALEPDQTVDSVKGFHRRGQSTLILQGWVLGGGVRKVLSALETTLLPKRIQH